MSDNITNKNPKDDEIDLLDLSRRMSRTLSSWARAVGQAFLISVVFMLRRWLPLGISLIVGVGVSFAIKTTSESYYSSDMVVRNNANPNSDMIAYINKLHTFCKERNYDALAEALTVNLESVKNIIDICAFWIIDKGRDGIPDMVDYSNNHNVYDTINVRMQDRFDVRVKIKSPQELLKLQNSIFSYVKKDSLFQQKNRVRLTQNRDMLSRLAYDIIQLDSLQHIKYFVETKNRQPQAGGQMVFLQEQKTQLVYTDIYTLYAKKQTLESQRDLYPEILTVLIDFNMPAKPENGTLFYGKYIIPLFFGITLLLLILHANRRKLTEVYNKY
jgi:hypothetical protein